MGPLWWSPLLHSAVPVLWLPLNFNRSLLENIVEPEGRGCAVLSCLAPGPLGYWVGPLPGGLGRSGSWGPGRPMSGCRGPGGVSGLLPLVPGGPLPHAYGGSLRGLPLLSSGWMRGCPCGGLPGFCAPWGLLVALVLWPSLPASDCLGGGGCGLWLCTLINSLLSTVIM